MADVSGSVLNRSMPVGRMTLEPTLEPVVGVRQVAAALTALIRSARQELLSFDEPEGESLADAAGRRAEPASTVAIRRIVPRTDPGGLVVPPQGGPSGGLEAASGALGGASGALGAVSGGPGGAGEARESDAVPFRMVLVDRSVAAVPLDLQYPQDGLLLIRDPVVVRALVRIHQTWWEAAQTPVQPVPRGLRPVLEALLAGLTDEAAASRLGMSNRTYSRRVCELLAALGTASRFRAGAEAARRGWI
ncbi:hypothetical protein HY68_16605 [Streptomyces sp. AcH 505]|uniref:response regulator transcription factor n=1 Tax=Streptomyces sp. AcH 505 TaxID=352211 RepID=UPI000591DF52|nr:hypothetical protein HY68_16605 [Streptomyces sp. AcH 505]